MRQHWPPTRSICLCRARLASSRYTAYPIHRLEVQIRTLRNKATSSSGSLGKGLFSERRPNFAERHAANEKTEALCSPYIEASTSSGEPSLWDTIPHRELSKYPHLSAQRPLYRQYRERHLPLGFFIEGAFDANLAICAKATLISSSENCHTHIYLLTRGKAELPILRKVDVTFGSSIV